MNIILGVCDYVSFWLDCLYCNKILGLLLVKVDFYVIYLVMFFVVIVFNVKFCCCGVLGCLYLYKF